MFCQSALPLNLLTESDSTRDALKRTRFTKLFTKRHRELHMSKIQPDIRRACKSLADNGAAKLSINLKKGNNHGSLPLAHAYEDKLGNMDLINAISIFC